MGKVKIQLNQDGIKALLKSAEIQNELERRAEDIATAAGDGHDVATWVGHDRVHATVRTATPEAARSEAEDRTLTRAIDAARY